MFNKIITNNFLKLRIQTWLKSILQILIFLVYGFLYKKSPLQLDQIYLGGYNLNLRHIK